MGASRELYAPELWGKLHEQYPDDYPLPTPDEQRVIDEHEIRTNYATLMAQVASPYKLEERETWFTQLKEADEYTLNNQAVTPMLTAMAVARGIELSVMVAKIKENDALFRTTIGNLLGLQQAELDTLS